MPQMKPLSWTTLYFLFLMSFMISNVIMFFIKFYINKLLTDKYYIYFKKKHWKW